MSKPPRLQASAADVVIVLVEDAPGATAEAHDFSNDPGLASKFFVCAPKRYQAGYSANGAIADLDKGHGGVYWYEDHELSACNVLTKVVERVEARRQIEFRARMAHHV